MRIFLNNHFFISVIEETENQHYYSCQVMELVNGDGMYNATFHDNQTNVVSCIVHDGFNETKKYCNNMQEVCEFHRACMKQLH